MTLRYEAAESFFFRLGSTRVPKRCLVIPTTVLHASTSRGRIGHAPHANIHPIRDRSAHSYSNDGRCGRNRGCRIHYRNGGCCDRARTVRSRHTRHRSWIRSNRLGYSPNSRSCRTHYHTIRSPNTRCYSSRWRSPSPPLRRLRTLLRPQLLKVASFSFHPLIEFHSDSRQCYRATYL